jgi:hypothetical protein
MVLNTESKYPNRRALYWLRGDATPGALAGRLENLLTGQQRGFRAPESYWRQLPISRQSGERAADAAAE